MSTLSTSPSPLHVQIRGLAPDYVNYEQAWEEQRVLQDAVRDGSQENIMLLLEHEPVFTAGRRTEAKDRPTDGTPVVDVDRGGSITWHGPGQLVGYPIIKLADPFDVVGHVRRLEEMLIRVCADFGVTGVRIAGRTGVWVLGDPTHPHPTGREDRKVAAIGIRVSRGITMHGFSLNCNPDLGWFDHIVPCGLDDAGVTSLTLEHDPELNPRTSNPGRIITPADISDAVSLHSKTLLTTNWRPTPVTHAKGEAA